MFDVKFQGDKTDVTALVRYAQSLEAQGDQLRAVLRPLLDHYLACYDGNKDDLATRASALLNP